MNKNKQVKTAKKESTKHIDKKSNNDDIKKASFKEILMDSSPIGVVILVAFMLTLTLSFVTSNHNKFTSNTNNTINKTETKENEEVKEEEVIENILGINSSLEKVENLADEKLKFPESENLVVNSKVTRRDAENGFYVITEDITLKSGIKEDDWGKYVINDDGVLYEGFKKSEGGIGMASVFNKEAENSSWYSSYGVLYLTQDLNATLNLGENEKYSYQELKEKEDNFMTIKSLFAMWGVYADGILTTDSETLVLVIGEPMTDEEIEDRQAEWNKGVEAKPYVRITLKNISEIYILNFDFKLNEDTKNFVNKWGAAVKKNR